MKKEGDITLTRREQERARVLVDLEGDRLTPEEAASALGLSTRQLRRLRSGVRINGVAGLVHGNRGRVPANACDGELAAQVVQLSTEKYPGFNQVFLTEMLERDEGILLSRCTVRRLLAAQGIPAPKPQRRSRHRRHRARRAQKGAMIQMDGSNHDWLEDRGPRLTLVGGIDDATGTAWAVFRLEEDTHGYFEVLAEIITECGLPSSVYTDRTAIALGTKRTPERVASGTVNYETQLTRVLNRLDITLIRARSPQAKGRIERLWKTLQDRLVCELRAKNIRTLEGAQRVLRNHLHFHNRNFAKPALNPEPAWREVPTGQPIEDLICWTYQRTVTNANTVSVEGINLQLEFPPADPGWARRKVWACRRLNGTWFARLVHATVPAIPVTTAPEAQAA
jgi:transposase